MNDACFFCTAPECDICIENREKCPAEVENVVFKNGWYEVQPDKGNTLLLELATPGAVDCVT